MAGQCHAPPGGGGRLHDLRSFYICRPSPGRGQEFPILDTSELASLHDALQQRLEAAAVPLGAAEAHGVLVGWLCAPAPPAADGCALIEQEAESTDAAARAALHEILLSTSRNAQALLAEPELGFTPLLPSDETSMAAQTEALAGWCRGFAYGLSAAGVRDFARLPNEVREFIDDLVRFSSAESDEESDAESEARALAEIVEYLRVGTQLTYETLRPRQ